MTGDAPTGAALTGAALTGAASAGVHLTDEQFSDLLLGERPAEVATHLRGCTVCTAEAARASLAIASFEQETRVWAERRAAAHPRMNYGQRPAGSWVTRPAMWAATAAVAVVVGIGGMHWMQPAGATKAETAPGAIGSAPSGSPVDMLKEDNLKKDNELMAAIDGELQLNDTAQADAYGLKVGLGAGPREVGQNTSTRSAN